MGTYDKTTPTSGVTIPVATVQGATVWMGLQALLGLTVKRHNALVPVCHPGIPTASGSVTGGWHRHLSELAVGVPGWQTGTKALCLYSQSPHAGQKGPSAGHQPG